MAKAPAWKKFVRTKEQVGAGSAVSSGKTPRIKMLDAIDKQIKNVDENTLGPKAVWHTQAGNGYRVKPRFGTFGLPMGEGDEEVYVYSNELKPFLEALRAEVDKGAFDAELEKISAKISATRPKKAAAPAA